MLRRALVTSAVLVAGRASAAPNPDDVNGNVTSYVDATFAAGMSSIGTGYFYRFSAGVDEAIDDGGDHVQLGGLWTLEPSRNFSGEEGGIWLGAEANLYHRIGGRRRIGLHGAVEMNLVTRYEPKMRGTLGLRLQLADTFTIGVEGFVVPPHSYSDHGDFPSDPIPYGTIFGWTVGVGYSGTHWTLGHASLTILEGLVLGGITIVLVENHLT